MPVLLEFLQRCERSSSEQYLALLVLNNVSIPAENKRIIAMDCGGAKVLSRLLCLDPSCHLLAIILVNLTFADPDLRRELVDDEIQLVDALAYALLESSSTPEEHGARSSLTNDAHAHAGGRDLPPRDVLAAAMMADTQLRGAAGTACFQPSRQIFPETARWCLSALKNLTRPSSPNVAIANAVVDSGILPLVLRIVGVGRPDDAHHHHDESSPNPPSTWEANSIQDAALFTVLNLAASAGEQLVRDGTTVGTLSGIVDHASMGNGSGPPDNNTHTDTSAFVDPAVGEMQQQFQCLKARMALAYLVGSTGHFGQPSSSPNSDDNTDCLLVTNAESERLIELLANTLHSRPKAGAGGYSAATFSVKSVLRAIRCLLTNHMNQMTFAATCGVRLNCLLLKAVAHFTMDRIPTVDAPAAEYAVWCLYLQSNYGFKDTYLPSHLRELGIKVLSSYLHVEVISAAGRHAAQQILQRQTCLRWASDGDNGADFDFDRDLRQSMEGIMVERINPGTRPLADILDRPIVRSCKGTSDRVYPSALDAVQHLSFGSGKLHNPNNVDDIMIANNIASCATGNNAESYNYSWKWQDAAPPQAAKMDKRTPSTISFRGLAKKLTGPSGDDDSPMTLFGIRCGQGGFCTS